MTKLRLKFWWRLALIFGVHFAILGALGSWVAPALWTAAAMHQSILWSHIFFSFAGIVTVERFVASQQFIALQQLRTDLVWRGQEYQLRLELDIVNKC